MKEKDIYYAVLMHKKDLGNEVCAFLPDYLIEGTIKYYDLDNEETDEANAEYVLFYDTLGEEYLFANDGYSSDSEEEKIVYYAISKEDLENKYPEEETLEDKKSIYLEELKLISHLGFYIENKDAFLILQLNLADLSLTFNSMIDEKTADTFEISTDLISEHIFNNPNFKSVKRTMANAEIVITPKKLNELINEKNMDLIKKQLRDIYYGFYNKLINNNELNIDDIKAKVFKVYDTLNQIDNLEEIKSYLKDISNTYMEICEYLESSIEDKNIAHKQEKYFWNLAEFYDSLLKLDNLNDIKERLNIIKEKYDITANLNSKKEEKTKIIEEEIDTEEEVVEEQKEKEQILDAKEMKKFFDEKIIGQEAAKKDVILSIIMNKINEDPKNKNSCLLVGPTGSGKTLIAETAGEFLKLPVEVIDTTQLTVPGYVGANIEDFLTELLEKAQGDLELAQKGIIVLDEIDKKGSESNSDVDGKGVLNTLLPFIQGTTYMVKYKSKTVNFNTENLTIIATGAFTDVANGKLKNSNVDDYKSNKIGFNSLIDINVNKEDIKYPRLEIDDFVKFGHMPIEFMGRFSCISTLSGHTKESLKKILTDSNISALLAEKKRLAKLNVELTWTDDYLDAVAEKALKLKTGARSLKVTVQESVKELEWEILYNPNKYKKVILTKNTVLDNTNCIFIQQNNTELNLKDILFQSYELDIIRTNPYIKKLTK